MRVDEVNDADGGADEEAERPGDEHAPEAPAHLELEHDILEYKRDIATWIETDSFSFRTLLKRKISHFIFFNFFYKS